MPVHIRLVLFLAVMVLLPLLTGCRESPEQIDGHSEPIVYRHAFDNAPTTLDPARASDFYSQAIVVNLFDTLFRYKYLARPYELAPNLATNFPLISADGLIYTIRIKSGVRFSADPSFPGGQGREVVAADFVYSIKRHFDPTMLARGAWLWQGKIAGLEEWKANGAHYDEAVAGLRALDKQTIQIQLIKPFPQLVHTLTQGYSAIIPQEAVEHYGEAFGINPVGSGPYRLKRFDSSGAVLARNKAFRREAIDLAAEGYDSASHGYLEIEQVEGRFPPLSDRIEVEFINQDAARWNAFLAGEVDFIKVPVSQFDRVLASRKPPELSIEFSATHHMRANLESGFVHTDFNMDDPRIGYHPDPDQDARNHALRCAINKAFDWQRRNEIFFYGLGRVFPGVIPPATPEYDPDAGDGSVLKDLDGAHRLLSTFGWNADYFPVLEYGFPGSVTDRQMFEQFRSFMADIGYPQDKIRALTYATFGDFARAYLNREVMLVTQSWIMDYPDAENTMQLFFGPNATPGTNTANFHNEQYDSRYRTTAQMLPSKERTALYQEMNTILQQDCATISGLSRTLILMWRKEVIMLPDRDFLGGYFFRFVQGTTARSQDAP